MEGILGLKRPLCSAARTKLKEEREEKRKWHKVNVVERHWEKVNRDVEWDEAGNEERVREGWQQKRKKEKRQKKEKKQDI